MRIGINIPDELMQRLEPLKPDLNISQVCREALVAKAEKYERMAASLRDEEINAAVDALSEREQALSDAVDLDWEMLGYEDAAAWTKAATWDDWDDLLAELHMYMETNWPEWKIIPPSIDGVKSIFDRRGELHMREQQIRETDRSLYLRLLKKLAQRDHEAINRQYMTAWLTHVKAVWELVTQRDLERLEHRWAQRGAPPTPEVPERMFDDSQSPNGSPFRVAAHEAELVDGVDPLKLNRIIDEPSVEGYQAVEDRGQ